MEQTIRSLHTSRVVAILSGGMSIALGFIVLVGWYTQHVVLVQLHPTFAPVQPNTAVLFVWAGVGVLSCIAQRPRLIIATGSVSVIVGGLTLCEYLFAVDLGIDQWLLTSTTTVAVPHPGRMPPNTALGFILIGIALLLLGQLVRKKWQVQPAAGCTSSKVVLGLLSGAAMLGSFVAALGAVASFGYLSSLETAYGWGQLTRMALVTAVGLTVLGVGIIGYSWSETDNTIDKTPQWFSLLIGVCIATMTLLLWQAVAAREQAYIRQTVREELFDTRKLLEAELESRLLGLVRMAKRQEHASKLREEEWEADASLYMRHYPGYSSIAWVDPMFRVNWLAPLAGNEDLKNVDLSQEEHRRTLLETARDQARVRVSHTLDLLKGGKGFLIAAPIFIETKFAGAIVGVFHVREIFNVILDQTSRKDFTYTLFDGEEEIYHSAPFDQKEETRWKQESTLNFHEVAWRLQISPHQRMLAKAYSITPKVILIVGFFISALCVAIVQLERATRRHAREVEFSNQSLQQEVSVRQEIEDALRRQTQALSVSEATLQQQTILLRSILDCMSEDVIVTDMQGQILLMNHTAQQTLGVSPDDASAKVPIEDWAKLAHIYLPDQQTPFPTDQLPLVRVMRGEIVNDCEQFIRHAGAPDGIWRSVNGRPLKDADGILRGGVTVGRNITGRKRMEEALRQSENTYRSLIEQSADAIFITDAQTNFRMVNAQTCAMSGYTQEELLQKNVRDLLLIEDLVRAPLRLDEIHANGNDIIQMERRVRRKDGTLFYAEARSKALVDGTWQTIVRDITAQKQAEEALRESEERFRRAFDDAAVGMALVALDGRFLRVNQSLCAMIGYDERELLATTFQVITHPDDLETNLEYARQLLTGEFNTYQLEKRYLHKNGDSVWILLGVSLIRDANDAPLYFVSQVQDITSRKQAEEALQASEKRFRSLCAASPIGIFQNTADGKTVYVNQRWMEIAGRTLEESLEDEWAKGIPSEERESVLAAWQACVSAGREFSQQFRLVRTTGEVRWVHSRAAPFYADDGRLIGHVGTTEDITARKQAEEQLAQQARELARSNTDLQEFASVASHDLQEPLRKIQTFVDLFLTEHKQTLDPQGRDYLERAVQAAGRMRNLIKDLLTLSRVSTKGQPFAPVDLAQTARDVKVDLETRIQETGGRVEIGELPILEADPTQMRQLLQNLLSNALKFHRKEAPPQVKVYSQDPSALESALETDSCCLVVEDNGIGFDEKYLERIFQPFQRLHGRQEYEGTGMGLAICRKIVERHGGQLTAKSAPQQGATFIITLPLRHKPIAWRAA